MDSSETGCGKGQPIKVLVMLGSPFLYGMERSVIELFDKLRPEVVPCLVMTYTAHRLNLPIIQEVRARNLPHVFLPDKREWPRLGKPRGLRHFWKVCVSLVRGNLCLLKAVIGKDAIYVPGLIAAYHAALAAAYMRIRGKRVIHKFHDYVGTPSGTLKWWSWLVTDFVHQTRTVYDGAVAANPCILHAKNAVVPNVLDLERDTATCVDPSAMHSNGKREIFFIGQIAHHKGIDLLLDAFKLVSNDGLMRLNIIGSAPPQYKEQFEKSLHEISLIHDVRFWGYRNDVLRRLQIAYLYIHPSPPSRFQESYGRGVVEAMSLGVPVVCFPSGSLREIVINNETGIVCDEETPECLAAAIQRFLADPEFRDRCGRQARYRYETMYSLEIVRPRWVEFFRGVRGNRDTQI
ncbi:MAG: glycosyltransferase family 4 protein [Terriglobales bacterium]